MGDGEKREGFSSGAHVGAEFSPCYAGAQTPLEYFFCMAPEECVSLCAQYMGFSTFLALSAANVALFINSFRLNEAWRFFGCRRRLTHSLLDLMHHRCGLFSCPTHSEAAIVLPDLLVPQSLHSPESLELRADNTDSSSGGPVVSVAMLLRKLFLSVGMETWRWRAKMPKEEAVVYLPQPRALTDGSRVQKRRVGGGGSTIGTSGLDILRGGPRDGGGAAVRSAGEAPRMVPIKRAPLRDCCSPEVGAYISDVVMNNTERMASHQRQGDVAASSSTLWADFFYTTSPLRPRFRVRERYTDNDVYGAPFKTQGQEYGGAPEYPLLCISEGELYSAFLRSAVTAQTMSPLRLSVVPSSIGFWPKSLFQGAGAQLPCPCAGVVNLQQTRWVLKEISGSYGRSAVVAASWGTAASSCCWKPESTGCVPSLNGISSRCDSTPVCFQRADAENTRTPEKVTSDKMGMRGYLAVAFASVSRMWPNHAETDEKWDCAVDGGYPDRGLRERLGVGRGSIGVIGLYSITLDNVGCGERFKEIEASEVLPPLLMMGKLRSQPQPECCTTRRKALAAAQLAGYVAFALKNGESISHVHALIFPSNQETYGCSASTRLVAGTTAGAVLCTVPIGLDSAGKEAAAHLEGPRRARRAWGALYEALHERTGTATWGPKPALCTERTCALKCYIANPESQGIELARDPPFLAAVERVLNQYRFKTLLDLFVTTLSDGVSYDVVFRDTCAIKNVQLFCNDDSPLWAAKNSKASWILALSADNSLKLLRSLGNNTCWTLVVLIKALSPLGYDLQPNSGLLALWTESDRNICFWSLEGLEASQEELCNQHNVPSGVVLEDGSSEVLNSVVLEPSISGTAQQFNGNAEPPSQASVDCLDYTTCISASLTFSTRRQHSDWVRKRTTGWSASAPPTLLVPLRQSMWVCVVGRTLRLLLVENNVPNTERSALRIKSLSVLNGHSARVYQCRFDGVRRLVSVDCTETLIVWDVWRGKKVFGLCLYGPDFWGRMASLLAERGESGSSNDAYDAYCSISPRVENTGDFSGSLSLSKTDLESEKAVPDTAVLGGTESQAAKTSQQSFTHNNGRNLDSPRTVRPKIPQNGLHTQYNLESPAEFPMTLCKTATSVDQLTLRRGGDLPFNGERQGVTLWSQVAASACPSGSEHNTPSVWGKDCIRSSLTERLELDVALRLSLEEQRLRDVAEAELSRVLEISRQAHLLEQNGSRDVVTVSELTGEASGDGALLELIRLEEGLAEVLKFSAGSDGGADPQSLAAIMDAQKRALEGFSQQRETSSDAEIARVLQGRVEAPHQEWTELKCARSGAMIFPEGHRNDGVEELQAKNAFLETARPPYLHMQGMLQRFRRGGDIDSGCGGVLLSPFDRASDTHSDSENRTIEAEYNYKHRPQQQQQKPQQQKNPQSRQVAWLDITPRRLTVVYKRQRVCQSWRF